MVSFPPQAYHLCPFPPLANNRGSSMSRLVNPVKDMKSLSEVAGCQRVDRFLHAAAALTPSSWHFEAFHVSYASKLEWLL